MEAKQSITKVEADVIGGIYMGILFYQSNRENFPTASSLIKEMFPRLTDDELQTFNDAALEAGQGVIKAVEELNERFEDDYDEPLPAEEERKKMVKMLACSQGMDAFWTNRDIMVGDTVHQFTALIAIQMLWEDENPIPEILAAIFMEGLMLAMLGDLLWPRTKGTPARTHAMNKIKEKFLVLEPKMTFTYPS
jgi:hypothetical protein